MISLLAYVGPGPGLSMGWALFALLATVFSAILAVFLWPIRVFLRKMRGGAASEEETEEPEPQADADESVPEADAQPPAA